MIHTETGIDLIPANKRLADAAARLQVMQFSQYNTAGEAKTLCEEVMDKLLDALREQYDYDCDPYGFSELVRQVIYNEIICWHFPNAACLPRIFFH